MQLTKAEEQVMQILWEMEEGLVKDIRDSSVIRNLQGILYQRY